MNGIARSLRVGGLARLLASSGNSAHCRSVSQDTGKSKIYELREYAMTPGGAAKFMQLCAEHSHHRVKYGNYFGYWNVEFGALNKLVHIWEYDSFEQRAEVRAALAKDKEWMEDFVKPAFPCLLTQDNSILLSADWCDLHPEKARSGAFELATYEMKIGGPKVWEEKLKSSVLAHARLDYTDLIGVWYTDIGDHNVVRVLWRYDSFDARREGRNVAHQDPVVVNKVRDNLGNVLQHKSVLMSPFAFGK